MSLEDHKKAMDTYIDFCKLGGSKSFLDLIESASLDNPFEEATIKAAVETIKSQVDMIDDKKF